jgi:predicted ABC-type transport system involved in lysophospholipase L1 biosynthesis ATPase subunit
LLAQKQVLFDRGIITRAAIDPVREDVGYQQARVRRAGDGHPRQLNAEGATIVMVTHSPLHAGIAKQTVHMLDGRILSSAQRAA